MRPEAAQARSQRRWWWHRPCPCIFDPALEIFSLAPRGTTMRMTVFTEYGPYLLTLEEGGRILVGVDLDGPAESVSSFFRWRSQWVVSDRNDVRLMTSELDATRGMSLRPFMAAATSTDHIVLSSEGFVVVLDQDLKELGRVTLVGGTKDAHDLLYLPPYVYALDNVVHPVYAVLLDLSDGRIPKVLARNEIVDVTPHLDLQLVDPIHDRWFIAQSWAHRGGGGQQLRAYSAVTGSEAGPSRALFGSDEPEGAREIHEAPFWLWKNEDEPETEGVRLFGTSSVLPCWAVLKPQTEGGQERYLARLEGRPEGLLAKALVRLPSTGVARKAFVEVGPSQVIVVTEEWADRGSVVCVDVVAASEPSLVSSFRFEGIRGLVGVAHH